MKRWLLGLMAISNQPGNQIDQEIVDTAMPRMGDLRNILQLVIDRLNDGPFAQEQLVHQGQQSILHILANGRNQLNATSKQRLKELLGNVALVREQLPEQLLG